jgi:glycosyltransferase involved in cell wall biosynthesis
MTDRIRVLIGLGSYHPQQESAGSNQSIRALMQGLSDMATFFTIGAVSSTDRDGSVPWHSDGLCQTTRIRAGFRGIGELRRAVAFARPDLILLNGFFDTQFTIPLVLCRRARLISVVPTIVSPRGEFAASALALKRGRKARYLSFSRVSALYRDVWLHATGERDALDIAAAGLGSRGIVVAPNLGTTVRAIPFVPAEAGEPLRLVFVGRISPMKNLDFAMRVLARVRVPVRFDVYGPLSDASYWEECEVLMATLPPNVVVRRCGEIANRDVARVLAGYDLFFMPTRGENFGHSIRESLLSGTPVLISDRTPWRELTDAGAGWDLPLDDIDRFVTCIETVSRQSDDARHAMRTNATDCAARFDEHASAKVATAEMFRRVLSADSGRERHS